MINNLQLKALELVQEVAFSPKNIEKVSELTAPEAARWAFTQKRLRKKGTSKFSQANKMFFTQEALEQASHEQVADYHTSLFPAEETVADLTCSIGADLIALAKRGAAIGYDLDPERIEYAKHNLEIHGLDVDVIHQDCLESGFCFDYAFVDPARRIGGRRTLDLTQFSPDPRLLAKHFESLKLGVIKLSPMLSDENLQSLGQSVQFLSHSGECKEALILAGSLAKKEPYSAVHIESGETIFSIDDNLNKQERPFKYIYEADPAAIRAHTLGTLCSRYSLTNLGNSNGYLTSEHIVDSVWLTGFEVVWDGSFHLKKIRKVLRELGGRIEVIKVRGPKIRPEDLIKKFSDLPGSALTLLLYQQNRQVLASIAKKV